jgi:hypothetical protein
MRQLRMVGAAFIAAGVLVAVAASTATATELGILPGAGNTFTGESKTGTLETLVGSKIECKTDTLAGKLVTDTHGEATVAFTGCKALGFAFQGLGESKQQFTAPVLLLLCYIRKAAPIVIGILVELDSAKHIEVPTLATLLSLTGSAVGKMTPVNAAAKKGPFTLAFSATGGDQNTQCEGKTESFKISKNEGTAESSGEATTEENIQFSQNTEVMG